ncbi:MAG: hypothetical protein RH862_09680 [Leptospiraceae bacterium]
MNLADRIIALQHIFPFSRLREGELAALAEVCIVRSYEPNELVLEAGRSMKRLLICLNGGFRDASGKSPGLILGIQSLLFDHELGESIYAADKGATCLLLEKGYFFRTMYELPEIAQGIVALQARQEVRS